MATSQELQFILKMRDEANAVLEKMRGTLDKTAQGAKHLGESGAKAGTSIGSLVEQIKEAAIAVGGLTTAFIGVRSAISSFSEYESAMLGLPAA
jgi:hypothetical protein